MSDLDNVKKKLIPRLEAAHYGQQDTVNMLIQQPSGIPFHLEVGEELGSDIDQDPEANPNINPGDIQVIRTNSGEVCDWLRGLAEDFSNIPLQVDLTYQSERSVTFTIKAAEGYHR